MEEEKKTSKQKVKEFCYLIGCSGLDSNCPGNPNCQIVRKVFVDLWSEPILPDSRPELYSTI